MFARLSEQQPEDYLLQSVRLFERPGSSPLPTGSKMYLFVCLFACLYSPDNVAPDNGEQGSEKEAFLIPPHSTPTRRPPDLATDCISVYKLPGSGLGLFYGEIKASTSSHPPASSLNPIAPAFPVWLHRLRT